MGLEAGSVTPVVQIRQDNQIMCHVRMYCCAAPWLMHPSLSCTHPCTLVLLASPPSPYLPPPLLHDRHFSSTRTKLSPHQARRSSILKAEDSQIAQDRRPRSGAHVERIGELGDGGKWVCGVSRLQEVEDCIFYSVYTWILVISLRDTLTCAPLTFSPFIQDPPGRHLSKLSYSLVPVTANSFSLTTLRRPFLAVSRPAQPCVQGLIHFTAH